MSFESFPDTPVGMNPFHSGPDQEAEAAEVRRTVLNALGPQKVYELAQAAKAGQTGQVMLLIEEGHRLADISPGPAISWAAAIVAGGVKSAESGEPQAYQNEALHFVAERRKAAFSHARTIVEKHVRGKVTPDKDSGIIKTEAGVVVVVQGTTYDFQKAADLVKKYTYRGIVILGKELDDHIVTNLRNLSFQVARTKEEFLPYAKRLSPTFGDKAREFIDRLADRFEPVKKITEFSKATREAWEMIPDGLKKPAYTGMKAGSALLAGAMGAYLAAHHPDLKQITPSFLQQAIEHPQNPRDGGPGLLGSVKKSSRADPPESSMRRGVA